MRRRILYSLPALVFFAAVCAADVTEEKVELAISTADTTAWGRNVGAWKVVSSAKMDEKSPKRFTLSAGKGVLVNGDTGRTRNLFSTARHGDVQAHIEFMVPRGSNSGVYFQGRYEVQILDSWGKKKVGFGDCGGIYQRWGSRGGYEGHAPRQNASLPPGKWQTFDVTFRAPRFNSGGKKTANAVFVKVIHNGKLVHENIEVTGPTRSAGFRDERALGPLMGQGDHGPVAYRNLRLSGQVVLPSTKDGADESTEPLKWHAAGASKPPRSVAGPDTEIVFENKTDRSVKLYWVGYRGKLQAYGELKAGATRRQSTFAGNTWLVTDENDKPLGYFIAEPRVSRAAIQLRK